MLVAHFVANLPLRGFSLAACCGWRERQVWPNQQSCHKAIKSKQWTKELQSCVWTTELHDNPLWVCHKDKSLSCYTVIWSVAQIKILISAALSAYKKTVLLVIWSYINCCFHTAVLIVSLNGSSPERNQSHTSWFVMLRPEHKICGRTELLEEVQHHKMMYYTDARALSLEECNSQLHSDSLIFMVRNRAKEGLTSGCTLNTDVTMEQHYDE